MKHYLHKTWVIIRNIFIVLIVLLAIIQGVARVLSPSIDRYRPQIESWLEAKLHQPVSIHQMTATWKGFHPVITFNQVTVFDKENKQVLLNINQLRLSVSVFKSLWYRRLEPSMFSLTGAHLVIHQLEQGEYDINGTRWHVPINPDQKAKNTTKEFFSWLATQGQIQIDQVSVDWYGKNGFVLPISNLKLKLTDGFFRRSLMGVVRVGTENPSRLRFVMHLSRGLLERNEPGVNFFIHAKNINLSQWLSSLNWHQVKIQNGLMTDVKMWGDWKESQFRRIQTVFNLDTLQLNSTTSKATVAITHMNGNLYWQGYKSNWKLTGHLQNYYFNKVFRPAMDFMISSNVGKNSANKLIVQLSSFALDDTTCLLRLSDFVSPAQQPWLEKANFAGTVDQLGFVAERALGKITGYTVSGNVQHLSWRAMNRIPGAKNISGDFCITPDWAWFNVNSQNVVLDVSNLFKHTFALNLMQTNLVWQKTQNGWEISAHDFYLEDPFMAIRGDMKWMAFNDKSTPIFNLLANFSQNTPEKTIDYLPQAILPKKFTQWMSQAFQSGGQVDGSVIVQGPIHSFPFDQKDGKFQIVFYPQQLNFSFSPDWPVMKNVDGQIVLDGRRMDIQLTSARLLNFPLQNAVATIDNMAKPILVIHTQTKGTLGDAKQLIDQSPLHKNFGRALNPLQMIGNMDLDLQLTIPMNSTPPPPATVLGNLNIQPGAQLRVTPGNLLFKNLSGQIQFTEKTLSSTNLHASLLDQPVAINLSTSQLPNKRVITNINLVGKMPIEQINAQLEGKLNKDFISGVFPYDATLSVKTTETQPEVTVKVLSDLSGVHLNLPPPWNKSAEEQRSFSLDIDLSQADKIKLLANYNKQFSGALTLMQENKNWNFQGGEIRFGSAPASFENTQGGLIVKGDLPSLKWSDITNYLDSLKKRDPQQNKEMKANFIRLIDVTVGSLDFNNIIIEKAHLFIQPKPNGGWSVKIDSPMMAGNIDVPANYPQGTLRADFDRLHLVTATSQTTKRVNPATLPAIYFTCRDFTYMDQHFGNVVLQATPQRNALSIDKLLVTQPAMTLYATGSWNATARGDQTVLNGYITSTNLGDFLKNLNLTNSLVGGTGRMVFQLAWAGPAYSPKLSLLNGHTEIDFRNGRIVNISEGAEAGLGLGRVLNLFSLQTLPRRLTLDFSDLTKSGFSFDVMNGQFNLQNGHAVTQKFAINGPVAKVEVSGRIGLATKDYDLDMVVTPYVTSSLPVIATIAGGPVAGAVTWAANKVFGSAVSKISSQNYHITGSWAEPNVSNLPAPNYQNNGNPVQ